MQFASTLRRHLSRTCRMRSPVVAWTILSPKPRRADGRLPTHSFSPTNTATRWTHKPTVKPTYAYNYIQVKNKTKKTRKRIALFVIWILVLFSSCHLNFVCKMYRYIYLFTFTLTHSHTHAHTHICKYMNTRRHTHAHTHVVSYLHWIPCLEA